MKKYLIIPMVLFVFSSQSQVNCNLPPTVGGVQYCPNNGYQTCSIDVNSVPFGLQQRFFCFSKPANVAEAHAVFMFHGGGHTGNAVAKHWTNQKSSSFIVLPSARLINGKRKWNTVNVEHPNFDDLETTFGHSDTLFMEELLQALEDQHGCDLAAPPVPCINNYYAAGFSSGAAMVFQLLTRTEFSNWFSGYGAVSNYIDEAKKSPEQPVAGGGTIGNINMPFVPVPIFYMMGTDERINLPLKFIISLVEGLCNDPDLIANDIQCFSNQTGQTLHTNRLDTALWLRQKLKAVKDADTDWYDGGNSDDTLITSQLYEAEPNIVDAVSVLVATVINGGHSWPSINNTKLDPNHSEDFETSDQLVKFWTVHADW